MTAIELNAQLLQKLSNISGNEGYLQKTLDFIKKLTKSDSATNARGMVYTEMLERLSDYQEIRNMKKAGMGKTLFRLVNRW